MALNLLEQSLGRQLTSDDEDFLYRVGHDDGGESMRTVWWICNRCGEPLIGDSLRHHCRRLRGHPAARGSRDSFMRCREDWEVHARYFEDRWEE